MQQSGRQVSFHVDPSDGLCTFIGSQFGDISTWNKSRELPEDVAERPENLTEEAEEAELDLTEIADAAFIAEEDEDVLHIESHTESGSMFFKNSKDLCEDLKLILSMPDMCDVTFLVGKTQTPVHGVKAILSTRSKYFLNLIMTHHLKRETQTTMKPKVKKGLFRRLLGKLRNKRYNRLGTKSSGDRRRNLEIPITEFEADIFQRVVLYMHSGRVNITLQTAIGVMNAADTYGLYDLRTACLGFAQSFITVNTVLVLLTASESYSQFKWTRILAQEIMEFICKNAEAVLPLPDFQCLPKSTAAMILLRDNLDASEETKWDAAFKWSRRHCERKSANYFRRTMKIFLHKIRFQELPVYRLEGEIRPLGLVPDDVITEAIAKQIRKRDVIGQEQPRKREVIGQEQSRVAPPKPPRRRSTASAAAAIFAPVTSFVRSNSSVYTKTRRRSLYLENEDSTYLQTS